MITRNAWDNTNSIGNTMSNFFENWTGCEFANLYFRESAPRNNVCKKYFHISEQSLLKNMLTPNKIGKPFTLEQIVECDHVQGAEEREKNVIRLAHKYGMKGLNRLSDILWEYVPWRNARMEKFIADFDPDIVFSFAKAEPQYSLSMLHLKKFCRAKLVLFIADDVYGEYEDIRSRRGGKLRERFTELMQAADKVYGISEDICREYGQRFQKKIDLLYKGADIEAVKTYVNKPIQMVYAGNLLMGRTEALKKVAREVERLNGKGVGLEFSIYTGSEISDADQALLDTGHTHFCGLREYSEIKRILASADMILHAESFESEYVKKVRYSISTKIMDALQCGNVLVVYGPMGIASVEYARRIPGAIILDSEESIHELAECSQYKDEELLFRARQINEYAAKHHDRGKIQASLKDELHKLAGSAK